MLRATEEIGEIEKSRVREEAKAEVLAAKKDLRTLSKRMDQQCTREVTLLTGPVVVVVSSSPNIHGDPWSHDTGPPTPRKTKTSGDCMLSGGGLALAGTPIAHRQIGTFEAFVGVDGVAAVGMANRAGGDRTGIRRIPD